jgi:hypothetical protein
MRVAVRGCGGAFVALALVAGGWWGGQQQIPCGNNNQKGNDNSYSNSRFPSGMTTKTGKD